LRLPNSVVDYLAKHASDEDVEQIMTALATLEANPDLGVSIPFHLPELKDCYVIYTAPDKKWRILFRRRPALFRRWRPYIRILAIELEG
jgi:hypothetical protein